MNNLRKQLPPLASLLPFETAARLGSFSKAAHELHITQAAISRQIRCLEQDLGIQLFRRSNRAVFLTEDGRRFQDTLSAALHSVGEAAVSLRASTDGQRVVLLCQLCEAFHWLMPRLADFQARHPEIEIQLVTSTFPIGEFTEPFDVAMQSTGRSGGGHSLAFTAADEVFPVCSPRYLEPEKRLATRTLCNYTLLDYQAPRLDFMTWEQWLGALGHSGLVLQKRTCFDSYPLTLQAAVAAQGIALGWGRTCEALIEASVLARPFDESVLLPDAISVYTGQRASPRPEVHAVLAWLQDQLRPEPGPSGR